MTEATDRIRNIKSLEKQLAYYSARKISSASRKTRDPAEIIDAVSSTRDSRVYQVTMAFKLAMKPQMQWYQGQELVYKATCPECRRRKITVKTIYKGHNAVWPPEDGYPDRCEACAGEA